MGTSAITILPDQRPSAVKDAPNQHHSCGGSRLSCEQIAELLPVWGGVDCLATQQRVRGLIDDKQAEIAGRIIELREFAAALDQVRATLDASPPPAVCLTDLSCCVPSGPVMVSIEFAGPSATAGRPPTSSA
jgi:hypothetical protein